MVRWGGLVLAGAVCLPLSMSAFEPLQSPFSYEAFKARVPIARNHAYVVNARIRPLLLFWIGRDDIGDARFTRREAPDGRRAFEFLIGSDPTHAPRRINRWGFIAEELGPDRADILGVMSESNEETIDEAQAALDRQDGRSMFRAARATVTRGRSIGGTMRVPAPSHFTYRDLDALLALIPAEPPVMRTVDLPDGTRTGFLVAMDGLLRSSVEPCRSANGARPRNVPSVPYVYNQTIFDATVTSCRYEPEIRIRTGTFTGVIDGRFQLRNRRTKSETPFQIVYGVSGDLREVPIRATFRPRWWLEIELLLLDEETRSPEGRQP